MLICLDPLTGQGCQSLNPDQNRRCHHCGMSLQMAQHFHDPGTTIRHYRILRILGYGRSGAVYKAEDMQTPMRQVALKETLQAVSIHQFKREFDVLSKLRHPNLPRYYDMFTDSGHGYLVMELVAGKSLQDIVNEHDTPLPEQTVIGNYALQLCDALAYLHAQEPPVLHRDIKPDNIRLTPGGTIKLVDFGLVKRGGRQQHTSPLVRGMGTPGYSPPEQYYGETRTHRTDQRSDIYSVGATLYSLLTGVPLPPSIDRTRSWPDPLIAPTHYNPALSQPVAQIIIKAMSIQPEDRYADVASLKQALQQHTPAQHGQSDTVCNIAYSPDGETFASVSAGHIVRLWRSSDASLLHPLQGNTERVHSIAYSPGGKILASGGGDGTVRLWCVDDGSMLSMLVGHSASVRSLAWSPDGQFLASASDDHTIRLWCIEHGVRMITLKGHSASVRCIAWSPDGQVLASASDDHTIRLWQRSEGRVIRVLQGHTGGVYSITWSPDGRMLASGSDDHTVRIWHVAGNALRSTLKEHKGAVNSVAWSPGGHIIASVSTDQCICLWRVSDGSLLRTLNGQADGVNGVAYSPDGKLLVSVNHNQSAHIWPMTTTRCTPPDTSAVR